MNASLKWLAVAAQNQALFRKNGTTIVLATGALEARRESDIFKNILVIFTSFYNSNVIHILNGSHIGVLPQEIGDLEHCNFALGSLGVTPLRC